MDHSPFARMTSETRLIYVIETLLTAVVGIAWVSVLQLACPRWPLLDTWALGGQAAVTVMTFLWSTGNGTHTHTHSDCTF